MQLIEISSPHNETLKKWRKLQQSRKERYRRRQLLIEGENLLMEARLGNCSFHAVLCSDGQKVNLEWRSWLQEQQIPVYLLRSSLYRDLMQTETPQGLAAVIDMPKPLPFHMESGQSLVLLLDQIQDPGNLGTILRTAVAAGVSFVGLGKGTVDPFNPKVVRSAAGALFRLSFETVSLPEWISRFRTARGVVVGTTADAGDVHYNVQYPDRVAFLLGNEGQGVAPDLLHMTDQNVRIPLPGKVESLNVATAGAVLLYEVVRQRGLS